MWAYGYVTSTDTTPQEGAYYPHEFIDMEMESTDMERQTLMLRLGQDMVAMARSYRAAVSGG